MRRSADQGIGRSDWMAVEGVASWRLPLGMQRNGRVPAGPQGRLFVRRLRIWLGFGPNTEVRMIPSSLWFHVALRLLQITVEWLRRLCRLRQGCWQKCGAVIVHVYATCLCGRWPWESIVLDIVLDLSWYLDLSWFIVGHCWPWEWWPMRLLWSLASVH